MNIETNTTNPHIPVNVHFHAHLPGYLLERLAHTPTITRTDNAGVEVDLMRLFPAPDTDQTGTRTDDQPGLGFDLDDARADYELRNPVAASLLIDSAGVLTHLLLEYVCRGTTLFGAGLDRINPDHLDLSDLDRLLPEAVVGWLASLDRPQAAAWIESFIAEIDMHRAQTMTGTFPRPHSTGSEMALHLILNFMGDLVDDGILEADWGLVDACAAKGFDIDEVVLAGQLRNTLFEDFDVLFAFDTPDQSAYAMTTEELHPANWFTPFCDDTNPWAAPFPS